MADDIVAQAIAAADGKMKSGSSANIWARNGGKGSYTPGSGYRPGGSNPEYLTVDQMKAQVLGWAGSRSPKYDLYTQKLIDSGFMSKSYRDQPTTAANALDHAVSVYQGFAANGGNISFDDWFDWYASTGSGDQSAGGGGAYTGPVTTTSTTVYSDKAAETVLQKMAREKFGYNLSKSEVAEYAKQLQAEQKKNPSVTRSAGTGGTRTSDTTQAVAGDVLAGEMLSEDKRAEDYAVESIGMTQMWDSINRGLKVIENA